MALKDFEHRRLEGVIDRQTRHPAPELKGVALAEQKRLLPLGRKQLTEHRSTEAQAPRQEGHLHHLCVEAHLRMPKVKLRTLARSERQRQVGWFVGLALLPDQLTHRGFGNGDALLVEFLPHPPSGPALFGRPALQANILLEPALDVRECRRLHGLGPRVAALSGFSGFSQ